MRNPKRLPYIYKNLLELHKKVPDWRFMQLMVNFMDWFKIKYKHDGYYLEDSEFEEIFKTFMKEMGIC